MKHQRCPTLFHSATVALRTHSGGQLVAVAQGRAVSCQGRTMVIWELVILFCEIPLPCGLLGQNSSA
jgi:hypothetical protein